MSFEQILLILFFIVLPLIQFLREAGQRSRERPAPDSPQRERPHVPKSAPPDVPKSARPHVPKSARPHVPKSAPPPVAQPAPPPVAVLPASHLEEGAERIISDSREIAVPVPRLPTVRRGARLGRMAVGLRNPVELRRAIVLKTIIEPCRAIDPYASPDRGGER